MWEAARHVSGWGRIHAVAQLEPSSDAIRRWLLLEGWHNDVMPEYSALTCVEKSGLAEVLHSGAQNHAEFTAAGALLPRLPHHRTGRFGLRRLLRRAPMAARGQPPRPASL